MRAPEITYALGAAKDFAGAQLEHVAREFSANASAISVETARYTVPNDKFLIVTASQVHADPGPTAATGCGMFHHPEGAAWSWRVFFGPQVQNTVSAVDINVNFSGELWIPPGEQIYAIATFASAGAPNNAVDWRFWGFLVPRGQVQQA